MYRLILLFSLSVCFSACAAVEKASPKPDANVSALVGELLQTRIEERTYLDNRLDPFGTGPAQHRFFIGYKAIKEDITEDEKLDLFWTIFWSYDLQYSELTYFLEIANQELGEAFQDRLNQFVQTVQTESLETRRPKDLEYAILSQQLLNSIDDS